MCHHFSFGGLQTAKNNFNFYLYTKASPQPRRLPYPLHWLLFSFTCSSSSFPSRVAPHPIPLPSFRLCFYGFRLLVAGGLDVSWPDPGFLSIAGSRLLRSCLRHSISGAFYIQDARQYPAIRLGFLPVNGRRRVFHELATWSNRPVSCTVRASSACSCHPVLFLRSSRPQRPVRALIDQSFMNFYVLVFLLLSFISTYYVLRPSGYVSRFSTFFLRGTLAVLFGHLPHTLA